MDAAGAGDIIKKWLESEKLETREVQDPQNFLHLHVRYPPTKAAHVFNIVIPKNRNLVLIYSITRVDDGQQSEMKEQHSTTPLAWETWLHDTRILLTQADLDWVLHIGKKEQQPGPLQAFNLSRPIWFDGLTQNEFMHTMRHVWLTKLALIHKIKFGYGQGVGKPGPVDDWISKKSEKKSKSSDFKDEKMNIDIDETGGFGRGFDRDEWA
tara:strand:+ start:2764 stop:3393 length:630 start_codon:yes stop_codon:yes gene_type:complete